MGCPLAQSQRAYAPRGGQAQRARLLRASPDGAAVFPFAHAGAAGALTACLVTRKDFW
jgi:hypothetical protein